MRARYYDPATGRFESEDSAKDGANWSLYAHGDPVNMVDPDGREPIWLSNAFWIRWDAGKDHVHWGRGRIELGAVKRNGTLSHTGRFEQFPSRSEMDLLRKKGISNKLASLAFDSITAALESSPLFVIGLFLDIDGDFSTADKFYQAAGAMQ